METTVNILIADTNVLIDLCSCGALGSFLGLDWEVCTTDLVVNEITSPSQQALLAPEIQAGRLAVLELSGDEIAEAVAMPTSKNLKRITDKTLLLKASAMACCLLTGDRDLRLEAESRNIEVHGSLWVLRQLLDAAGLSRENLQRMLEMLEIYNPRLPSMEIQKLRHDIEHQA
ncbi:MAG: hypothetical protein NW241_17245 [Bacteroidia bacterium]|nr:hypothetical protein [Bacteroidia bacterium]